MLLDAWMCPPSLFRICCTLRSIALLPPPHLRACASVMLWACGFCIKSVIVSLSLLVSTVRPKEAGSSLFCSRRQGCCFSGPPPSLLPRCFGLCLGLCLGFCLGFCLLACAHCIVRCFLPPSAPLCLHGGVCESCRVRSSRRPETAPWGLFLY